VNTTVTSDGQSKLANASAAVAARESMNRGSSCHDGMTIASGTVVAA
jgi:hypothetical protein